MTEKMLQALDRAKLRPVVVEALGRDALIFRRYGLALLDAEALRVRESAICEFIAA